MTAYKLFLPKYSQDNLGSVSCFSGIDKAKQDPRSGYIVQTEDDIIDAHSIITMDDMVKLYNSYTDRAVIKKVKRFADRKSGAKRLMDLFRNLQSRGVLPSSSSSPKKISKSRDNLNETRGRKSVFKNLKLYTELQENPRRKNSFGFNSMQIIIDNPGITYEDFISKHNGRRQDLAWDIEKGRVRVAK